MITVEKQRMLKSYEKRLELREKYERERIREVTIHAKKRDRYGKEDMLNLPRHQTNCPNFVECPLDYKCRNYNPTYIACVNCKLHEIDGICHKNEIHNEATFAFMISRERIDLDDKQQNK
jgi:hypothetical protein